MKSILIKMEDYVKESPAGAEGVKISLRLSPYDVPREVKGECDDKTGIFTIKFAYLDEEEALPKPLTDKVTMNVGRYSGKILGFQIHTAKYLNLQEISLELEDEIQEIAKSVNKMSDKRPYNQRENYRVVGAVLQNNLSSLSHAAA